MLAWWDEPPEELDACIRTLPVLCDRVIAVDGAYEMTPGATASSDPAQAAAIKEAALDVGIDFSIITPSKLWAGQVAKRSFMLQLAAKEADWLLAFDADHRLIGDRRSVRTELEQLGTNVDSILHPFYTPLPNGKRPAQVLAAAPHDWHRKLAGRTIEHSLLFRRLKDMRLDKAHWGYTGVRENGARVGLGLWKDGVPQGRHQRLRSQFRVDHVCFLRDQMRLDRNKAYCAVRDQFARNRGYEP